MVDRIAREGINTDFEYRLLMPDGSVKHVHIMFEASNSDPENREFIGTVVDITTRKQAEDELRKAQAELARVARITTLGELAASIAHEISQPLGAVVNSSSACLRWLAAHNLGKPGSLRHERSKTVSEPAKSSSEFALWSRRRHRRRSGSTSMRPSAK
jgi:C4-dicarboxylate-specific signal transduction histidine kinase